MKEFEPLRFDPRACRKELDDLGALLDTRAELGEREDVLGFFRARRHLAAFISSYFPYLAEPDQIAFEYDLFGDFTCDLAIGDVQAGQYGFIEFEGAHARSLFEQKRGKVTPEWSKHFEHGFSQVLDWLWELSDMEGTTAFLDRFGPGYSGYQGMLVIGRSTDLGYREQQRLRWRRDSVTVGAKHVHCVTYDELYQHLDARLRLYESAFRADEE